MDTKTVTNAKPAIAISKGAMRVACVFWLLLWQRGWATLTAEIDETGQVVAAVEEETKQELTTSEDESEVVKALDMELAAVEQLIAAQQKRLEILASLRRLAAQGISVKRNTTTCGDLRVLSADLGCDAKSPSKDGGPFEDVARELFEMHVPDVSAVAVLTFRVRTYPQRRKRSFASRPVTQVVNVVAVGFRNRTFALVDAVGGILWRDDTLPNAPTHFAVDGGLEDLGLAVACGPTVVFFDVALYRDGRLQAGRRWGPRNNGTGTLLGYSMTLRPLQDPVTIGNDATAIGLLTSRRPASSAFDPSNATHLAKYLRQSFVIVGRETGNLDLVHRGNGSTVKSLALDGSIQGIAKAGSSIIVGHGSKVSYVSPHKWSSTYACDGGPSQVVRAFAPQDGGLLYVAYDDGHVLLFRPKTSKDTRSCRVLHQVLPPSAAPSSVVTTSRGFIATASYGSRVTVHNTSSHSATSKLFDEPNATRFFFTATTVPSSSEVLFVYAADNELRAFESLAKYEPPHRGGDVAWMRMPILIVGVLVVFGYQILQKNNRRSSGFPSSRYPGGGSSKGGGFAPPDAAEFERLVKHLERDSGGGSFGD